MCYVWNVKENFHESIVCIVPKIDSCFLKNLSIAFLFCSHKTFNLECVGGSEHLNEEPRVTHNTFPFN